MARLLLILLLLSAAAFGANPASTVATEANPMTRVSGSINGYLPADPGMSAAMVTSIPEFKPQSHPFFDRTNLVGITVHAAVRITDAAQTCSLIGGKYREAWLPMKSCPGITAYSLSMIPAQMASSYLLHRRGYHKMERLTPYLWAAPSAAGIAMSIKFW